MSKEFHRQSVGQSRRRIHSVTGGRVCRRRLAILFALIAGSVLALGGKSSVADAPLEGTKPAHWRVIWTLDPATSATLSWDTAKPGKKHVLRYWKRGDKASEGGVVLAESGRYTGSQEEFYYHHARLTGLQPSTAYSVQMQSDQESSPEFYFVTGPAEDRSFSLLHGGDSRTGREARRRVNQMMAKLVDDSLGNEGEADDVLAFAHGGDYIVSGPNLTQWSQWLSDHELTTGPDGRLLPIIPARGNHDKGKPFNEVFGFPDGDLNYYAINLGPQVRFVTLNTETSTAGDQAKWLGAELKASRGKNRWLLAQYHRPAFPAVKTPASCLYSWVPLFEKHNVDLVCEADGHNIKRTVPIRNNVQDASGVVYIGEGGLGVPQRTPKSERWYLQPPGMTSQGDHVFLVTFGQKKILGRCVLENGGVADSFERPVRQLKKADK